MAGLSHKAATIQTLSSEIKHYSIFGLLVAFAIDPVDSMDTEHSIARERYLEQCGSVVLQASRITPSLSFSANMCGNGFPGVLF